MKFEPNPEHTRTTSGPAVDLDFFTMPEYENNNANNNNNNNNDDRFLHDPPPNPHTLQPKNKKRAYSTDPNVEADTSAIFDFFNTLKTEQFCFVCLTSTLFFVCMCVLVGFVSSKISYNTQIIQI